MNRREFALAMTLLGSPALAQKEPVRRIGVLMPSTRAAEEAILKPFYDGMVALGWIEGKRVAYERMYGDNDSARLPQLAVMLVSRKPDVIFTPTLLPTRAAKAATQAIPIVFALPGPADQLGVVQRLARPEANLTGVTGATVSAKRAEVLKEMLPGVRRVGALFDPNDAASLEELRAVREAREKLDITLIQAPVPSVGEIEAAMTRLLAQSPDALLMLAGPTVYNARRRLLELASRAKVAVAASNVDIVKDGAVLSYSNSLRERLRYAARYVDRVLKGAQPGELPVEQNANIEFVVNLKSAHALGIRIPQSILLRADRVIE